MNSFWSGQKFFWCLMTFYSSCQMQRFWQSKATVKLLFQCVEDLGCHTLAYLILSCRTDYGGGGGGGGGQNSSTTVKWNNLPELAITAPTCVKLFQSQLSLLTACTDHESNDIILEWFFNFLFALCNVMCKQILSTSFAHMAYLKTCPRCVKKLKFLSRTFSV